MSKDVYCHKNIILQNLFTIHIEKKNLLKKLLSFRGNAMIIIAMIKLVSHDMVSSYSDVEQFNLQQALHTQQSHTIATVISHL